KRKLIRDHLAKVEKEKLNVDDETADDNVEIRFDRTLRIKRALLEKANLTAEVDPVDDGVFESDLLLTEEQSNLILNDLGKAESTGDEDLSPDETDEAPALPPTDADSSGTRAKRSGVFIEQNFAEKWDISTPIPYTFDDSIAPWDQTDINDALAEISRVSCVRFRHLAYTPNSYHINFV
ncbi:hypothetical protein PMAYCL1PPCAC_00769, partial [Pristionchus mayeri]